VLASTPADAAEPAQLIAEKFEQVSLTMPTPAHVFVCHGFDCRQRTEVGLGLRDHQRLARILSGGHASAAAERQAIVEAVAWLERRVAPEAGTAHAVARSNHVYPGGHPSQLDCIDTTMNTMSYVMVLEQLHLLRHHRLDLPVSRHLFVDGEPHTTAVILELKSRELWAVDPWTHNNGEPPDLMRLAVWKTLN
jgi:hypothetical protein